MELTKNCLTTLATDLSEKVVSELDEAIEDIRLLKSECSTYAREEMESIAERLEELRTYFE